MSIQNHVLIACNHKVAFVLSVGITIYVDIAFVGTIMRDIVVETAGFPTGWITYFRKILVCYPIGLNHAINDYCLFATKLRRVYGAVVSPYILKR